jgi:enoyl-CoA hydratase/carnithine racemase
MAGERLELEVHRLSAPAELPVYRTLQTNVGNGVGTVTLHRPDRRNAIGDGMREELADAYLRLDGDDAVRVLALTGTPPAFCAGADLGAGERTFAAPGPEFSAAGIDVPAWSLSKPVIAAVNGHALGLGLTLALQCDIRIFAADAKYGVVQVRRGVVGDAYVHWVLPRLVGLANAAEVLLTGATFDGHRAVALGLGSRVLDAAEVLPAALEVAHDIAANTAPMSVAASKRLLWDSFDLDRAAVGARETEIHRRPMGHDDARKGVRAHLERRRRGGRARPGAIRVRFTGAHRRSLHTSRQSRVEIAAGLSAWRRHRKREPGENPGLSRSGMQERPPSSALARRHLQLGRDGH